MPYLATELRQALNLVESCPSEEAIAAACAARGLQLSNGELKPLRLPRAPRAARAKEAATTTEKS